MGYTVIAGDGSCDLATLDLVTGTLTDLPAASSAEACAIDLAAAPDGTVYGIGYDFGPSAPTATCGPGRRGRARFITYAADGTATTTTIAVEDGTNGGMSYGGGIAVSASGTIYVHLVVRRARLRHRRPEPDHHPPARSVPRVRRRLRVPLHPRRGHRRGHPRGHHRHLRDGLPGPLVVRRASRPCRSGTERSNPEWATESTSTGEVTVGAAAVEAPLGYDCDSTAGGPLWSLQSPNGEIITAQATEVTIEHRRPCHRRTSPRSCPSATAPPTSWPSPWCRPPPRAPTTTIDVANAN